MYKHLTYQKVHFFIAAILIPVVLIIGLNTSDVHAGVEVLNRYDELNNSSAGVVAKHTIGFTFSDTSTNVGSILIQFCDNSPLQSIPCTFPSGMDVSAATVEDTNETGNPGYTMADNSGGQILLTNPSAPIPNSSPSTYTLDNITNPTSPGQYYVRIQTFSSTDGTGPNIEYGGIAIQINSELNISSIVPPYLIFCGGVTVTNLNCGSAQGDQIDFGNLSSNTTSDATSQFVVATNAINGYNITVSGNTMTSGNYVIPNLTNPNPSKVGNPQFGLNLVPNSIPQVGGSEVGNGVGTPTSRYGTSNFYTFNNGDTIASSANASDYSEYTASYLVNVPSGQPAGVYATTIIFICLANF